ncbi:MAG: DNA repair protein RadA, partial [Anaerotignaceae bacterium]
ETEADMVIVDSIQTFQLNEFLPSRAGNPTQTMECASALVNVAKNGSKPVAVMIIGQMNKNDELAGIRSLEHLVDTVLIIDGDNEEELRSVIATKNRFGSTGEMGFFAMTEKGLVSIDNPSEFFVTKREAGEAVSGSAVTVVREGSRPVIAEVESLVSRSFTPYPSRIGEALKREQLNTLISILEQRCNINLFDKNVVIKSTGGLKLKEQSSNLAVLMCIASSVFNKPIGADVAFIADVGLTGELKKVPSQESRIKELDRMGFASVFVAQGSVKPIKGIKIKVEECKYLSQVIAKIF